MYVSCTAPYGQPTSTAWGEEGGAAAGRLGTAPTTSWVAGPGQHQYISSSSTSVEGRQRQQEDGQAGAAGKHWRQAGRGSRKTGRQAGRGRRKAGSGSRKEGMQAVAAGVRQAEAEGRQAAAGRQACGQPQAGRQAGRRAGRGRQAHHPGTCCLPGPAAACRLSNTPRWRPPSPSLSPCRHACPAGRQAGRRADRQPRRVGTRAIWGLYATRSTHSVVTGMSACQGGMQGGCTVACPACISRSQ